MRSILPTISMTELMRNPKQALQGIKDYAVIQSHGCDKAFVLHPMLGRILVESGMLDQLRQKAASFETVTSGVALSPEKVEAQLSDLIGNVLRELSKK